METRTQRLLSDIRELERLLAKVPDASTREMDQRARRMYEQMLDRKHELLAQTERQSPPPA